RASFRADRAQLNSLETLEYANCLLVFPHGHRQTIVRYAHNATIVGHWSGLLPNHPLWKAPKIEDSGQGNSRAPPVVVLFLGHWPLHQRWQVGCLYRKL